MNRKKLSDAIFKIAVAFVLLHADVNFGRLNILPDWLGYALILGTLNTLAEEEPSAKLLETPGYILVIWSLVVWAAGLFGISLMGYGIAVIVSAVQLYFRFQLLTNIASIAEKYAPRHRDRILKLRSVMTVVITGYILYSVLQPPQWVTTAVALVYLAAAVLTCKVLGDMNKDILPPDEEETPFSVRLKENAEAYDQLK